MKTSDNAIETKQSQALAVLFLSIASSNGAADGLHMIATQRERGTRKAADLNARVVHEFVEIGVSAADYHNRPAIAKLLAYLDRQPDVRYVIFPKIGRVSRVLEDFHELMSQFDNRGVIVMFPYGNPEMSPAAREALWRITEWTRERSPAARAHRRRKASTT
ncbi:recombinase family protein [Nocardia amamiensis]|uniref:Recombinase family protein n=1 Tax=Nocardia amamiensis TaxID=404578 RepID=A0ABS0CSB8_9NOCA|nr:recombinase family protein [Nocardia amamiensis]MBF6299045.1 recombinase family protein [Nocardia amamiensis]